MADRLEQAGSWAQSDVIQILQDKGVLPSHANDGIALANTIGALASSYAENLDGSTLTGKQKIALALKGPDPFNVEAPIYEDSFKERDEIFWLTPVSTSGYNGTKDSTFKNVGEGTIIDNDTNGQVVKKISSTGADGGDRGMSKGVNYIDYKRREAA